MGPMSLGWRRVAAISSLLLAGAIVAVLALRGFGVSVAIGPFASPTPPVATNPPIPPSDVPSADPGEVFGAIATQVQALRMLPDPGMGPVEVITRAELGQRLRDLLLADWSAEQQAADNLTLRGLGLLTATQDVVALTERLYGEQVLGYYDPQARQMVIVSDAGNGPAVEITYAHEYTHALQDAAFDAETTREAVGDEYDRRLALVALAEGDATTSMVLWALDHLTTEELLGVSQVPVPDAVGIPAWMVHEVEFPYTAGAGFVARLYETGGWDAVNAAYGDPPRSSEQVLHYEAYVADEPVVTVSAPDLEGLGTALGGEWRTVRETTLGEAWVGWWLEAIGADGRLIVRAAPGWGGDRISVASGPDGAWALAWHVGWDVPLDVTEFDDAYTRIVDELPFAAELVPLGATDVLVVHASSPQILDAAVELATSSAAR